MALSLDRVSKPKDRSKTTRGQSQLRPWQLPDASFIEPEGFAETADMGPEILDSSDWNVQIFHALQEAATSSLSFGTLSEALSGALLEVAKGSYTLSRWLQRKAFLTQVGRQGFRPLPVPRFFVTEHPKDESFSADR